MDLDERLKEVYAEIEKHGKVSIPFIQKKLKIGYKKACQIYKLVTQESKIK